MSVLPVFSTQYFGCIYFYHCIIQHTDILFETHEYYIKQTYRNRQYILTANGVMPLIIPVVHHSHQEKMIDKEICFKEKWHKKHYTAIVSAYKNAPYFEYYADELLSPLLHPPTNKLFEFNFLIIQKVLSLLNCNVHFHFTKEYYPNYEKDFRQAFYKNIHLPDSLKVPYLQVFSDRFKFQENLSIIDAIFNLGPEVKTYLASKSQ